MRPFLLALALLSIFVARAGAQVTVADLRCEYRQNPLGIDATTPRLTWQLRSNDRGVAQSAYQVLVASSPEQLQQDRGDLWDSGRVSSDQSVLVDYAGQALTSGEQCFWKVRVWDQKAQPTAWSAPASWSMGLLQPTDWKGQWIGLGDRVNVQTTQPAAVPGKPHPKPVAIPLPALPARYVRQTFQVSKPVAHATVYVCGLGLFELHLNGQKIGDHVLEPALTDYEKRCDYVTFDITDQLHQGDNAVGVILGNGRFYEEEHGKSNRGRTFGLPRLLLQMQLEFADGSRQTLVSDQSWRITDAGPIRTNSEYDGETYDATRELTGWDTAGYADRSWQAAEVVRSPGGVLCAQMIEPIRVTQTLGPIAITQPHPGVYIFDMGQNMVGRCRLRVSGPAGTTVQLRHAETLTPAGDLYTANLRSAQATDHYTLKGEGEEVYAPRFTYHGFRYVEVTGFPGTPTLATLQGEVMHDDLPRAGEFACSNDLLNKIAHNILWGVQGNYRSIATDCPQRDERQGWLGDRAAEAAGEAALFNVAPLYSKILTDIGDAQRPDGMLPDLAPTYWPTYSNDVTWPSLEPIVAAMLYDEYGDRRALQSHYPVMTRWMAHMSSLMKSGISTNDKYGDWCSPPVSPTQIHTRDPLRNTPGALLATSYQYHNDRLMARIARILNKPDDARHFDEEADHIAAAFNQKFYNASAEKYANGSQTSYVLPLAFGLVPADGRDQVFHGLVDNILSLYHGHLATGLVGGQWLMRTLTDNGRPDVAYTIATQRDYPSWGYMVDHGATTVWELWNGNTADPAMNSGNHVMLVGDLYIWMTHYLGGIRPDPERPGYQHIIIEPVVAGDLTFVNVWHESPYGRIVSQWKRDGDHLALDVTIPPNTTATVSIPAASAQGVTESSKPLSQADDVKPAAYDAAAHAQTCDIGSGVYHFASDLK